MKRIGIAGRLGIAAAALAGILTFTQPFPAQAHGGGGGGFHGGGGGFHGGGFHGGGFGGFHGGGFHGGGFGGFHGGGFRGGGFGGFHPGVFHGGFGGGRFGGDRDDIRRGRGHLGWWWGGALGLTAAPYLYGGYDDSGYGADTYSQPNASQYWYYCQNPAGYYPYVSQCSTTWQPVPAN